MKKSHLHGPFTANKTLNAQQAHWEKTFLERGDMFGLEPSYAARRASEAFKGKGGIKILELGGGQGRDTLFFAGEGFRVNVLDYSNEGLKAIREKSQKLGVSQSIVTLLHDIRQNLPFEDESFDGCFSHMFYCMALTTAELEFISQEIRRVLKPEGLNIYTVRNTNDAHYQTGIHRGEDMWEVGGFTVHFFNREKVEHLAEGYTITGIEEFEEGNLPRRLFLVTLKKDRNVSNTIKSPRSKKPGKQQEET
ncbi:MAG: class I SAM-dependent methyltransferase [Proteobacteria bacterium]|nr:class I SAM-dependent methyltransferase [Pseudomonadota bacterium]